MTTLQFVSGLMDWLLADPSHIVTAASALAAITPTPDPATPWGKGYRLVELFAFNFLHAKESGKSPASPTASAPAIPAPAAALAMLLAAGLALSACAGKPPSTTLFELRAGYDSAVLVPMAAYAGLPQCPAAPDAAGTVPACAKPEVLAELAKADAAAKAALDAAEDAVRRHPDRDPSAAIATADSAVTVAKTVLATNNVH